MNTFMRICKYIIIVQHEPSSLSALTIFFIFRLVAETAGELQGLLTGDLGDLGDATLTMKHVNALLETLLEDVFRPDTVLVEFNPHQQFHLELVARLFKCAQRFYLEDISWTSMHSELETGVSFLEWASSSSAKSHALTPKQLLGSPFWNILRFTFPVIASGKRDSQIQSDPMIQEMLQSSTSTVDIKSIIPVLRIVTTCAYHFPSGQCWTSSLQNWYDLGSIAGTIDGDCKRAFTNLCNGDDLCLLIKVLADVLEWSGSNNGSTSLRVILLRCTNSLTKTMAVLAHSREPNAIEMNNLRLAWRRIWDILLRPDLAYHSSTKNGKSDCLAREVLALFREMIVRSCLDSSIRSTDTLFSRQSSYVYQHQSDIWNLPCYSQYIFASSECFLLLYCLLSRVGISESGTDSIEFNFAQALTGKEKITFSRRSRLLIYCLRAVESGTNMSEPIGAVVASCMGALVYGSALFLSEILQLNARRDDVISSQISTSDVLCRVWMEPLLDPRIRCPPLAESWSERNVVDIVLGKRERSLVFSDYVPDSEARSLLGLVTAVLLKPYDAPVDTGEVNEDSHNADDKDRMFGCWRYLITVLICSREISAREQQTILATSTHLIRYFSKGIKLFSISIGSFWSAFSQMIIVIRTLSTITSESSIELSSELLDEAVRLSDICKTLLDSKTVPHLRLSHSPAKHSDALFSEETDDEEFTTVSKKVQGFETKRKRGESSSATSAKKAALECVLPSPKCTLVVGALLLALNPSAKIACKLAGVENVEATSPGDFDVLGAAIAAHLLCMEEPLLSGFAAHTLNGGERSKKQNNLFIIHRLLSMIRGASPPEDDFHLFGFQLSEKIVVTRDNPDLVFTLNSEESRCLKELLVDAINNIERKTFQTRPFVRALQFQAAINSFIAAGDEFHETFDKEFARTLVLPSLFDTNNHVRRIASRAVACAIRLLPEGKVTESIRKRLFLFDADGSEKRDQYREWYTAKIVESADLGTLERQVWEDLFLSMRGSCLNHWCALASESTNDGVLKQFVFDLVLVAKSTPACEGLCFQSLSHMARLKGEQNCELCIDHCVTYLVDRWLERELSLLDFPLFITSPLLVGELLKHGHWSRLLLVNNGETSDVEEMRRVASADFIARFSHIIIPRVLLSFVKKRLNKGTSTDLRRETIDDGYIKELCLIFTDHFDEEEVRKFLGSSLPETIAHLSWLSSESDDNCNIVQEMEQLLRSLLSEEVFVRRLKSRSFNAQKYLLYLSLSASLGAKNDVFLKAHNTLSMMASTQFFSGSFILLFFYARYLMSVRLKFSSPRVIWIPLENVIALGETLAENDPRCISFCQIVTKLVSCMLGDETFQKIHLYCLPLLTLLSNKLLNVGGESSFLNIFGDLLLVVFQVLDENIIFLIDQTELSRSARHAKLTRSLGLVGGQNISRHVLGDTWGWCERVTFDSSMSFKRCPKRSAIVEACQVFVSGFVTKCSNLQSLETKLVEAYQASRLSSLSKDSLRDFKSLLDARDAIEKIVCRTNTDFVSGTEVDVSTFISDVQGRGVNREKIGLLNYTAIYTNRLINKLARLEKVLHDSRSGEVMLQPIKSSHVQTLGLLCSSGFPRNIRLAASRCFGELNMSTIVWDKEYPLVGEYWLYSAVKDNRLLRTLQTRCIESLFFVLESPNPLNSSIAAHTLTSVLSTRVGAECRGLIVNEVSALLEVFYSQTKRSKIIVDKQLILEGHEIALLRTKCGVEEDSVTSWCLTQEAWSTKRSSSYEEWLCAIVPSIIVCLYSVSGEVNKNDSEFFWLLQKITFLESSVAAALFPALIVDLLHRVPDENTPRGPAEEDLIDKIGGCFETLLKQCTEDCHTCDNQERQYLDLILNTIEILRRATQSKFMSSRSQKKSRLTDEISTNEKNKSFSRASIYSCARAIPWGGLRFGVILHLDGYLIMRAFLKAGRVTAAILYAEMYADSKFGGSSWTRESINAIVTKNVTAQCGSGDISGIISHQHTSISNEELALISRTFLSTLGRCYEELEEADNLKALTQFLADIDVHSPENFLSMLRGKDDVFESCQCVNENQATIEFANGLDQLGLDFALQHYISGASMNPSIVLSENETTEMKEKWYKCQLTRMCWTDNVYQENNSIVYLSQQGMDLRPGFFESTVNAVTAMERSDYNTCCEHVEEARWGLLLSTFNMDVRSESEGIFRAASYLRSLNDLQRFVRSDTSDGVYLPPALEDCGTFRSQRELPFYCRELVLRHNCKKNSGHESKHVRLLLDQLWQTSSMSLKCGDLRMASGALSRIHIVLNTQKEEPAKSEIFLPMRLRLRMEETLLLEKSGNFTSAITSTQRTIERLSQQVDSLSVASQALLSELMLNCSRWMAKYKTDPIHHVLMNVLSPGKDIAIRLLESDPKLESNINRASECLMTMGSLGHLLFESGLTRINSLEFQRSEESLASRREELDECKRLQKSSQLSSKQSKDHSDLAIYEHNLSKEIRQMEAERSETLTALNAHLKIVLDATSQAFMIVGTNRGLGFSTYAYRLISVWFSAIDENMYDVNVDKLIHEAIERTPSFRFVPLANQLFARLDHERIQGLVVKLCLEHPYHCLVHLIAACNGNNVGKGVDGRSAATFLKNTSDSKVETAHLIVQTVKQKDPEFVSCLFESYRTLSDAYIHLAMAEVKRAQKISFASISSKSSERLDSCLGRKGRSEFMPCIFTKPPPIRPGRDYGEGREDPKQGERVLGFDAYFLTSESGVHVPKIVVCNGTKGGTYRQLVKGQDEIRQDAVMQQVFGLLNEFVAQNQNSESSRKHAMHQLITYNIIPLTPTSGVRSK
jgi:hypothetical protein